jgi:hypothetical protein
MEDWTMDTEKWVPRVWVREPLWEHTVSREAVLAASRVPVTFEGLTIGARIGSDSSNGEVYLATARSGHKYALKLFNPNEESATELEIATRLGGVTKTDLDLPFPLTFGSGLVPPAFLFEFKMKPGAQYLVSELANGDLVQLFTAARESMSVAGGLSHWAATHMPLLFPCGVASIAAWKKEVAFHAFCCMRKLHALGYAHLDSHQGNFMALGSGKIVIHDFGTTKPATPETVAKDFDTFFEIFEGWQVPRSLAR